MTLAFDVEGVFVDDCQSDWDVATIYKLSDEQYSAIVNFIDSEKNKNIKYNIQSNNCTTFAINVIKAGNISSSHTDIVKHDWFLPSDTKEQLKNYQSRPSWIPATLATWWIELTMGNFFGFTPADAAEDLKLSDGHILLKEKNSVKTLRK